MEEFLGFVGHYGAGVIVYRGNCYAAFGCIMVARAFHTFRCMCAIIFGMAIALAGGVTLRYVCGFSPDPNCNDRLENNFNFRLLLVNSMELTTGSAFLSLFKKQVK